MPEDFDTFRLTLVTDVDKDDAHTMAMRADDCSILIDVADATVAGFAPPTSAVERLGLLNEVADWLEEHAAIRPGSGIRVHISEMSTGRSAEHPPGTTIATCIMRLSLDFTDPDDTEAAAA